MRVVVRVPPGARTTTRDGAARLYGTVEAYSSIFSSVPFGSFMI